MTTGGGEMTGLRLAGRDKVIRGGGVTGLRLPSRVTPACVRVTRFPHSEGQARAI